MTAASATDENGATRTLISDLEGVRAQIADAVRERPLAATAVAAGVGFVLGGGLTRRVMTLLIATGTRAVGARIAEHIRESAATTATEPRTGGTRS